MTRQSFRASRWLALALAFCLMLPLTAHAQPVIYVAGGGLYAQNTATNTTRLLQNTRSLINGAAVSPDGGTAYAGGSQSIFAVSTATGKLLSTIDIGEGFTNGIVVSPDGTKLYTGVWRTIQNGAAREFFVDAYSAVTAARTARIVVSEVPWSIVISPDGSRVYAGLLDANSVVVINTATNAIIAAIPVAKPYGMAISPNGAKLYVTNASASGSTVTVIATDTNTVSKTINVGAEPFGVAVTPDGSKVYVANRVSGNVSVISTATDTNVATISTAASPVALAVAPDGSKLFIGHSTFPGVLSTASVATNSVISTASAPQFVQPYGIAISAEAPSPTSSIFAATLPQARTAVVKTQSNNAAPATFFASITNADTVAAKNCKVSLSGTNAAPVTLSYQTANAQNAPAGQANTPVTIAGGSTQNYIVSLTANAVYDGFVGLAFTCAGVAAPLSPSVNDFHLKAEAAATGADIIPVALTLSGDGVVRIANNGGVQALAAAAVNIGASASITVQPNVIGGSTVPLSLVVIETDQNGAAITQPARSIAMLMAKDVPRYFSVFATGVAGLGVPLQPDKLRIVLSFTDSNGVLRGQTSAAVVSPGPGNPPSEPLGFADNSLTLDSGTKLSGLSLTTPGNIVYFQSDQYPGATAGSAVYFQNIAEYDTTFSGGPFNGTYTATSKSNFRYSDITSVGAANGNESSTTALAGFFASGVGGTGVFSVVDGQGQVVTSGTTQFSTSFLNLNTVSLASLSGSWTVQNARAEAANQVNVGTMAFSPNGVISGAINGPGVGACNFEGQLTSTGSASSFMNIANFSVAGPSCQIEVINADRAFVFRQTADFNPFIAAMGNSSGTYYEIVYLKKSSNRANVLYLKR